MEAALELHGRPDAGTAQGHPPSAPAQPRGPDCARKRARCHAHARPAPAAYRGQLAAHEAPQQQQQQQQRRQQGKPPSGPQPVDEELWALLEVADEEELQGLYSILFGSSPFSPLLKSLTNRESLQPRSTAGGVPRGDFLRSLEARYRFLAADALSTLRGRQPSYREALLAVRAKLGVPCPRTATTQDLELEIFNHVVARFSELMPHSEQGGAVPLRGSRAINDFSNLPPVRWGRQLRSRSGAFLAHLTAPLTLSLSPDAVLPTLGKLGGALTAARVAPRVAAPVVTSTTRLCLSMAASPGSLSLRAKLALETATKSAALTAGRVGPLASLLAVAGPALWIWAVADVALAAAGTDYARLTRATFALAQIRLLRTAGFQDPAPSEDALGG